MSDKDFSLNQGFSLNLPTLTVDGDPVDWFEETIDSMLAVGVPGGQYPIGPPIRDTVRVDVLPTVTEDEFDWHRGHRAYARPLRVGDRVALATKCPTPTGCPPPTRQMCPHGGTHPFATATVTKIVNHGTGYFVTVSDVKEYND